jgi:hypothetical protein
VRTRVAQYACTGIQLSFSDRQSSVLTNAILHCCHHPLLLLLHDKQWNTTLAQSVKQRASAQASLAAASTQLTDLRGLYAECAAEEAAAAAAIAAAAQQRAAGATAAAAAAAALAAADSECAAAEAALVAARERRAAAAAAAEAAAAAQAAREAAGEGEAAAAAKQAAVKEGLAKLGARCRGLEQVVAVSEEQLNAKVSAAICTVPVSSIINSVRTSL